MAARRLIHAASFTAAVLASPLTSDRTHAQTIRPLSTDRPDRTESPYSVPAEHFQLEMDLVTFGHFATHDLTIDGLGAAPFNLKYGFTNDVDVQLVFTPYLRTASTPAGGTEEVDDGTGPLGVRFKINLTGNDSDGVAAALLPYIFTPTRGTEKLDNTLYGLLVPVTFPLAGDRAVGTMIGVEQLGDTETFGIASVTISTPIVGGWGGFVELFSVVDGFGDEDGQIVTLDAGIVFAPRDDWALDAGVYYGVTSEAENWRVFVGASARR
ncbi:MAG TPA: transporter [Candidatus Krumholzibacteria bacterium]|nr:transporter [Candidatus Krumholzibacteria bacterium]